MKFSCDFFSIKNYYSDNFFPSNFDGYSSNRPGVNCLKDISGYTPFQIYKLNVPYLKTPLLLKISITLEPNGP